MPAIRLGERSALSPSYIPSTPPPPHHYHHQPTGRLPPFTALPPRYGPAGGASATSPYRPPPAHPPRRRAAPRKVPERAAATIPLRQHAIIAVIDMGWPSGRRATSFDCRAPHFQSSTGCKCFFHILISNRLVSVNNRIADMRKGAHFYIPLINGQEVG